MTDDEFDGDADAGASAWHHLAQAVLLRCIADANGPGRGGCIYGDKSDIRAARRFLTAETGGWAEARRLWCDYAGVDPDALREAMLKRPWARKMDEPSER